MWSRIPPSHTVLGKVINVTATNVTVGANSLFIGKITCFLCTNRGFSNTETLCSECKYYCEQCRSKQEAQKRYVVPTDWHGWNYSCSGGAFAVIFTSTNVSLMLRTVPCLCSISFLPCTQCIRVLFLCTRRYILILKHLTIAVAQEVGQ